MEELKKWITDKPDRARWAPYFLFVIITAMQGMLGDDSSYWMYALKTAIGAWMIWATWGVVKEMRWTISWEAVAVGFVVFGLWVGLDGLYPPIDKILSWDIPEEREATWNPFEMYGAGSLLGWFYIVIRIAGSSLVVPLIEETFFRSFVYRWLISEKFEQIPLGKFEKRSFFITCIVFGLIHFEWLPGILCGFLYVGLVIRKKRLGDAITAHAITNFLLGLYVVIFERYYYW